MAGVALPRYKAGKMEAPATARSGASFMPTRVGGRARNIGHQLNTKVGETRQRR